MQRDLTRGNVFLALIQFAIPVLLGNLLQSCYTIADMAIVGNLVGSAGLAAVESASRVCYLIASIGTGFAVAGTVIAARERSAGNEKGLRERVGALALLTALAAAAVTATCVLAGESIIAAIEVPVEAREGARRYLLVAGFGTICYFGFTTTCAVLRGLGDATGPLAYGAVSVVLNVALDILFVGPLGMGVAGAALATVLAQAFSFATAIAHVARKRVTEGNVRDNLALPRLRAAHFAEIAKIGIPAIAQTAVLNLSYLLSTGMFNAHGLAVAAASGIGLKINTVVAMPCWAIGQAVVSMTAQCLGAGKEDRARKAALTALWLNLAIVGLSVVLVRLFAGDIVSLFADDPAVIAAGTRYLLVCCSVNFVFYATMFLFDSFATGTGNTLFAMVNSLLHSVALRLALSVLLDRALGWGADGLYWGEALSPIVPCLVGIGWFLSGIWRKDEKGVKG